MISVCIATHNGEKYIKEQLVSILEQIEDSDEIIISDDGSTDNTIELIHSLDDDRIKIVTIEHSRKNMKPHWYVTKNFENSLKHAKGDMIFLADQDDIWMPNKIEKCIKGIGENIALLHNLRCVDINANSLGYDWYNQKEKFRKYNILMMGHTHQGCALCFKKELLNFILPFPENLYTHDFWIGIIAELKGGLRFLDEDLMKYRIHGNNTSIDACNKNTIWFQISYRLYNIIQLLKRII